jgi:hypothetical protein
LSEKVEGESRLCSSNQLMIADWLAQSLGMSVTSTGGRTLAQPAIKTINGIKYLMWQV